MNEIITVNLISEAKEKQPIRKRDKRNSRETSITTSSNHKVLLTFA